MTGSCVISMLSHDTRSIHALLYIICPYMYFRHHILAVIKCPTAQRHRLQDIDFNYGSYESKGGTFSNIEKPISKSTIQVKNLGVILDSEINMITQIKKNIKNGFYLLKIAFTIWTLIDHEIFQDWPFNWPQSKNTNICCFLSVCLPGHGAVIWFWEQYICHLQTRCGSVQSEWQRDEGSIVQLCQWVNDEQVLFRQCGIHQRKHCSGYLLNNVDTVEGHSMAMPLTRGHSMTKI